VDGLKTAQMCILTLSRECPVPIIAQHADANNGLVANNSPARVGELLDSYSEMGSNITNPLDGWAKVHALWATITLLDIVDVV
jgi:hypothetical protein